MNNIGLHLNSNIEELTYPNGSVSNTWERISFMLNNKELFKASTKDNSYGIYVDNGTLYINGEPYAKDLSVTADTPNFGLVCKGDQVYFGKTKLTIADNEIINITKEDYSLLLEGSLVDGYTVFNPDYVYNIVDSITSDNPTTWNRQEYCTKFGLNKLQYAIYNNIVGLPFEHNFTENHFLSTDTPSLNVHDYNFRIVKGDRLKFMVMVDTKRLDKLVNKTIYNRTSGEANTFTIIVKDKLGHVLFKRTVYAGEIYVELEPFKDSNNNLFAGETWFSVECIDNKGCGSAVRYYDLLIRESNEEVTYVVSESKLSDPAIVGTHKELVNGQELDVPNTITPNNSNEKIAYYNKVGFTNLFEYYANLTYNGKPITKLVIPKNVYYINYHKLIDSSPSATHPFGECKFYIYELVAPSTIQNKIAITPGRTIIPLGGNPQTDYEIVDDPLEFVRHDKYRLYRVKSSDVTKYGTNGISTFVGDDKRVLTSDDIGNIWVRWRNSFIYDQEIHGRTLWEITGENQEDELHLRYLNAYDPSTEVYVGDTGEKFLRTYSIDKLPTNAKTGKYIPGTYYVVERTSEYGDNLVFPDNMTIDFNGSTLKATRCQDSNGNDLHYFDLSMGHIVYMEENYNTHIKNLKVEGVFHELDWVRTSLVTGRGSGGICEAVNNISTGGSRFCSYENVESVYALCYDCNNLARTASSRSNPNTITPSGYKGMFAKLGYIDFNGNVVEHTDPIREVSGSRYETAAESLVYDEKYRGCYVRQYYQRKKNSDGSAASFVADDFTLLGGPYVNGNGKHYEMFVAFYNIPGNNVNNGITFKGLIKTRQMYRIKCPAGATHYRVVGYGLSELVNGVRVSLMRTSYATASNAFTNIAFPSINLGDWTYSEHSKAILYKNCYFHDSRSTAFSVETAKGVTFDGCTCNRIAYLPYGDWSITKILGSFEDGGYKTSMVTIKNCTFLHTKADYQLTNKINSPGNKLRYDEVSFLPLRCRDFTVVNNKGLTIGTSAAIYDGYIADNEFEEFQVRRGQPVPYRHMVYRNNKVFRRLKKNYYSPGAYYDPATVDNDVDDDTSNDNQNDFVVNYSDPNDETKYREFNCDDAPSYKVVMQNAFIAAEVDNTHPQSYVDYDYNYIRSKVVNKTYR